MKKQLLLMSSVFLLFGITAFSQNNFCSTDEKIKQAFIDDPNYKSIYEEFKAYAKKYTKEKFSPNEKGTVYQVPIVFHIMHNYGAENISDNQIYNTIESMNDHWRKNLADSSAIQAPFNLIHDDMEVEFVLATKDPNGDCSTGITRHVTELTYSAGDNVKSFTKAKLNWPSNRYLNVWVVASIASGAGGYSYFPGISAGIDGIVVLRQQLSALPHEAGHWLALPHPWGGTNDNNLASNCNDDDGIDDTPNTRGQSSCFDLVRNSCDDSDVPFLDIQGNVLWPASSGEIHDNVQNIMDYAFCGPENFTQGQKAVVRAALTSSTGGRNNLYTTQNLQTTGTDGTTCNPSPIAEFDFPNEYIPTNYEDIFRNNSHNSNTAITYLWEFSDEASISTSDKENPIVSWSTLGRYGATLTASNNFGSSTRTLENIVKVLNSEAIDPFIESFESIGFPNNGNDPIKSWFIDGLTNNNTWEKTINASTDGNASIMLDTKKTSGTHRFISPAINMQLTSCDTLYFDVAYSARVNNSSEVLRVKVSKNGGLTWSNSNVMFEAEGKDIDEYAVQTSGDYVPAEGDWTTHAIDFSKFNNEDNILVMFEFEVKVGNSIYIDNINFGCASKSLVGEDELLNAFNLTLYPNPTNDDANIRLTSHSKINTVYITDVTGRMIATKQLNVVNGKLYTTVSEVVGNNLNKGIYFVTVENNNSTKTEKLIIK